jgi:hypothetical protein
MVAIDKDDNRNIHVGVLTLTPDPNGGTKPASEYDIPIGPTWNVRQSYHMIHRDELQHFPHKHVWDVMRNHKVDDVSLAKMKKDTEDNRHQ